MHEFRADLHCHTTCSDGSLSPIEIVQHACSKGLNGLSITDHDTIAAYHEAYPASLQMGIPLISGVEFSTMHKKTSVHVLAYSFTLNSAAIEKYCQHRRERRLKRNEAMLHMLA